MSQKVQRHVSIYHFWDKDYFLHVSVGFCLIVCLIYNHSCWRSYVHVNSTKIQRGWAGLPHQTVFTSGNDQLCIKCLLHPFKNWGTFRRWNFILAGQKSGKKNLYWRKKLYEQVKRFHTQIWWYAVHLQRDSLNSFKGCLWRQKHWWQLTFITSLKPFQIRVWNSGFASFPCRTCTHANFRKIFDSLQSGEFHAG